MERQDDLSVELASSSGRRRQLGSRGRVTLRLLLLGVGLERGRRGIRSRTRRKEGRTPTEEGTEERTSTTSTRRMERRWMDLKQDRNRRSTSNFTAHRSTYHFPINLNDVLPSPSLLHRQIGTSTPLQARCRTRQSRSLQPTLQPTSTR